MLGDMDIRRVQIETHTNAQNKGFYEKHYALCNVLNGLDDAGELLDHYTTIWRLARLMLVTTEVAEAAEAVRKDYAHTGEELADAVIRIADTSEDFGFDLTEEIRAKMKINEARPYMHGKKA